MDGVPEYKLIIFGATGRSGRAIAKQIFKVQQFYGGYEEKKSSVIDISSIQPWALAGRNEAELQSMKDEFSILAHSKNDFDGERSASTPEAGGIDILIADIANKKSVKKLVKRTKLLINCTGPYEELHNVVLKYCLKYDTHYIDCCFTPQEILKTKNYCKLTNKKRARKIQKERKSLVSPAKAEIFSEFCAAKKESSSNVLWQRKVNADCSHSTPQCKYSSTALNEKLKSMTSFTRLGYESNVEDVDYNNDDTEDMETSNRDYIVNTSINIDKSENDTIVASNGQKNHLNKEGNGENTALGGNNCINCCVIAGCGFFTSPIEISLSKGMDFLAPGTVVAIKSFVNIKTNPAKYILQFSSSMVRSLIHLLHDKTRYKTRTSPHYFSGQQYPSTFQFSDYNKNINKYTVTNCPAETNIDGISLVSYLYNECTAQANSHFICQSNISSSSYCLLYIMYIIVFKLFVYILSIGVIYRWLIYIMRRIKFRLFPFYSFYNDADISFYYEIEGIAPRHWTTSSTCNPSRRCIVRLKFPRECEGIYGANAILVTSVVLAMMKKKNLKTGFNTTMSALGDSIFPLLEEMAIEIDVLEYVEDLCKICP